MSVSEQDINRQQEQVERLDNASDRLPECAEITWRRKQETSRLRLMQQRYALQHHPTGGER